MFTGIIETIGTVSFLKRENANLHITVNSSISRELKADQSVSHNGVCLTITNVEEDSHTVVAIDETLSRSNLGALVTGSKVNLERALSSNGRFDGHFVQGHVDDKVECLERENHDGSWLFRFAYNPEYRGLLVEKGSICVDGVSLTIAQLSDEDFSVAVIPYTFEHTCFQYLNVGAEVNLEFDVIGKYVKRNLEAYLERGNLPR